MQNQDELLAVKAQAFDLVMEKQRLLQERSTLQNTLTGIARMLGVISVDNTFSQEDIVGAIQSLQHKSAELDRLQHRDPALEAAIEKYELSKEAQADE